MTQPLIFNVVVQCSGCREEVVYNFGTSFSDVLQFEDICSCGTIINVRKRIIDGSAFFTQYGEENPNDVKPAESGNQL